MYAKLFVSALLVASVTARYVMYEVDPEDPVYLDEPELHEELLPQHLVRQRRSPQGLNLNIPPPPPDNTITPIANVVHNPANGRVASETVGLALNNVNGHALSLSHTDMPGQGHSSTAAGTVRLINNDNHKLDANAFATHTTLNNPAPSFNTYGGGVDYMFKDKVGVGTSMARTPLFDKTDYSAGGKLNLYRSPSSSLDFNAGVSRSISPYIPKSSWEPTYGLTFRKFF